MKMTSDQFEEHQADLSGYCSECDAITTSDVESDAQDYECPECGNNTVMGVDQALLMGNIEITDDEDDFDDDDDTSGVFID